MTKKPSDKGNRRHNVKGRAGKKMKRKGLKGGRHKPGSRVEMSRLVHERLQFAREDDRSRLCAELGRVSRSVNTVTDKARQLRQDHNDHRVHCAELVEKHREDLREFQAGLQHKYEEQMQIQVMKIAQQGLASGGVPKLTGVQLHQGKLGEESIDMRHASHAVDDVVRKASRLLGMGAADRHMLMGAALRIVETCLADGSELPKHALAATRLTYRSSSASTWALAVFQTALALGGHGAVVRDASHVVRTIAPDDSVRKSAWGIQCRLINVVFGSSMYSAT